MSTEIISISMSIGFIKQPKDFVFSTQFNIDGVNTEEVIKDLANEDWIANQPNYGQGQLVQRYFCNEIKNPFVKSINDFLINNKRLFIDTLYAQEYFPMYWGISPDRMDNITNISTTLLLDKPDFDTKIHLDNRLTVATGMIYFIDQDDPKQSTSFYSNNKYQNQLRIPTGFGAGWFAANMHDSWHSGHNLSNQDRYSMIYNIVITA